MDKGKVDMDLIRRYIRGELPPRDMYALERQAQADPMLMDIILGMEQEALKVHGDNLADIRKRIAGRTAPRQTAIRRLTPAQRWAIAAAILAVLTVGTWWFIRDDTGPRHEAAVATPKEAPQAVPEVEPSPEAPSLAAAPPITREEKKATRLAKTTPKTNNDAEGVDSVIVIGYGTQTKSARVGAAARLADARIDTPVLITNEQAFAGRTEDIRIRGMSPRHLLPRKGISGKVVDEETQKPMAGVALQTADGQRVATDAAGRFTLPDTAATLTLNHIGYEQQTVAVTGPDTLTIALTPSNVGLDEVVVVGYATGERKSQALRASHPKTNKPQPEDGWVAYRKHLRDAVKPAPGKGGTVELTFTVGDDGRPADITVVKTTDEQLNAFAVLIVRDGPSWLPGSSDERAVTLRVEF